MAENPDLREYGLRRNAACEQLRENAVRMASENATLLVAEEDSMAACFLLEVVEIRESFPCRLRAAIVADGGSAESEAKGGRSYGAAFASHVRALLEEAGEGAQEISNLGLGWSSVLVSEASVGVHAVLMFLDVQMQEALNAMGLGRASKL